jgi:1-phosphofructokinase
VIVTLTANPSVDRTIEVAALARGAVIRALSNRVDAGGKGVNVARALTRHGYKATAIVVCGGAEGAQLHALLNGVASESGLDIRPVAIAGSVRSNVTVVEADGTTTKLNERGPRLSPAELEALAAVTVEEAAQADWVVLSGSLPPGAPVDWYARLIDLVSGSGAQVAVDTSGEALAAAVDAGPSLVKPNRSELAEVTGRDLVSVAETAAAAGQLISRGVNTVLVSLGPAGAVLVDESQSWHASAPAVTTRNNVGAGDAALAGFLAFGGGGPDALVEAVAWGSAAVALPGSRMPSLEDITYDGIRLTDLNSSPSTHRLLEEA